ncbi:NAD(P)/FAD-dependent oxidoreductase [Niallia sp. Krafla_26]|uniref:NAD(P)/FAD-dependent oxidoreductase n=1 Tax=Niallia sp. Krafla_26 TaxID=3064703 RepID=UPI003D16D9E8
MNKPKIVVIGAGFAGLMAVTTLQKELNVQEAEIILVNKHEYHYQRTWLHQVAGGTIHPNRVRFEISPLLDKNKVRFVKKTVSKIDTSQKKVIFDNQEELSYDYLVVALGGEQEEYGIKGIDEYALAISSVNAARGIRNHIEEQFRMYHTHKNDDNLTIVVGGAGLTGIEFLGELTEWVPKLCRQYHVDQQKVKYICVQSSYPLQIFEHDLAEYAVSSLKKKGVQFILGKRIKECKQGSVLIGGHGDDDLEEIKTGSFIWAAGVRGNKIIEKAGIETVNGRVEVQPDLRVPGFDRLFIIGDCSVVKDPKTGEPYSPTAQIALQQGITCAENIISLVRGEQELKSFDPHIRGIVCALGKNNACGVVYGKKLKGSKALAMKKLIDNRALYMIGGSTLLAKKGRVSLF